MARTTSTKHSAPTAAEKRSMTQSNSPYSFANLIQWVNNYFSLIFIVGLFFLAGFFVGSLWTQNQLMKNGSGLPVAAGTVPAPVAPTEPEGPTPDQLKSAPEVTDADYSRGNANAKVTLIEYSDFECPFCARFHPTMNQLMAEYGDDINWVYRHYPLSFHPSAQKAAEASECVASQTGEEGFWQFVDKIFEENTKLGGTITMDTVNTVATSLGGVNQATFKTCLDSGEMAQKVKDQLATGTQAGVSGTPGTILRTDDGQVEFINGAVPYEQLKATVEKYL